MRRVFACIPLAADLRRAAAVGETVRRAAAP